MGTESQENARSTTSVYLYEKDKKMANTLIKSGYYKSFAELVRANIERDFREKISNPKEELQRVREKLKEVEKELEGIIATGDDILSELVKRYEERKSNMPAKALGNYEKFSKNWITKNMSDALTAFPGKTIDEIYIELEKLMKK